MCDIAQGLVKTNNNKRINLHPAFMKNLLEISLSIYKEVITPKTWLFMFADYSALLFNTADESMIIYTDARRDLLEISLRIQNLSSDSYADFPAYLRRDILKWLRENGD